VLVDGFQIEHLARDSHPPLASLALAMPAEGKPDCGESRRSQSVGESYKHAALVKISGDAVSLNHRPGRILPVRLMDDSFQEESVY
jgi:hypothetical protein